MQRSDSDRRDNKAARATACAGKLSSSSLAGVTLFVLMTGQLPIGKFTDAYPDRFFTRRAGLTDDVWAAYNRRARVFLPPVGGDTPQRTLLRWLTRADPFERPSADMALSSDVTAALFAPAPVYARGDLADHAAGGVAGGGIGGSGADEGAGARASSMAPGGHA